MHNVLFNGRGYSTGSGPSARHRRTIYPATGDVADHAVLERPATRLPLLGHAGQLCGAFFHRHRQERGVLCLDSQACIQAPNTVLVVALRMGGATREAFVARYTSCYRPRNNSVHAEEFMMADARLSAALRGANGATLRMYMSQQPCHYSAGRHQTRKVCAKKSCTERVLRWFRNELAPRGMRLDIRVARLFRAAVREGPDATVLRGAAKAREGLALLGREDGVSVRMCSAADWVWLCGRSAVSALPTALIQARVDTDAAHAALLQTLLLLRP